MKQNAIYKVGGFTVVVNWCQMAVLKR